MEFATKKAGSVVRGSLSNGRVVFDEIRSRVTEDMYELMSDAERIHYLNILAQQNQAEYTNHLEKCQDPDTCTLNEDYERVAYFFSKELNELGVELNEDMFSGEEKKVAEEKLDTLLRNMEELKVNQMVTFQLIFEEMEELRDYFYLGKKKWKQLFIGKGIEMAVSGIVSETVSKQILSAFNDNVAAFLNR